MGSCSPEIHRGAQSLTESMLTFVALGFFSVALCAITFTFSMSKAIPQSFTEGELLPAPG